MVEAAWIEAEVLKAVPEIHALDLKCMTPAQAETAGDTAFDPHGGGQGVHIRRIQKNKE
jgi:hypothetical protein